jgi:hypothetical protein
MMVQITFTITLIFTLDSLILTYHRYSGPLTTIHQAQQRDCSLFFFSHVTLSCIERHCSVLFLSRLPHCAAATEMLAHSVGHPRTAAYTFALLSVSCGSIRIGPAAAVAARTAAAAAIGHQQCGIDHCSVDRA